MVLSVAHHVVADGSNQGRQQLARCANPTGQCGAVQIDAFARINLRLTVQWNMVRVLGGQNVGQQCSACQATLDWLREVILRSTQLKNTCRALPISRKRAKTSRITSCRF